MLIMGRKMSKDAGKRLEEKERLDAEIARSLSVVKVKEAHKQIEDVEKLRKKSAITSIIERLNFNIEMSKAIVNAISKLEEKYPKAQLSNLNLTSGDSTKKYIDVILSTFESIKFDLERNIDVNKQDFDRLFPKVNLNFDTYASIVPNIACLGIQMMDLKNYCLRLL